MSRKEDSPALVVWKTNIWPFIAFVIVLIILPIMAPFLLIMRAYRKWLTNKLAYRRPDIQVMKETDAIWFQNSDTNLGVINSLWWMKGTLNSATLLSWQRHIDNRIASGKDLNGDYIYPKLRSAMKTVWHRYVWFPIEDFNIADYVTLHEEKTGNRSDLEILLGNISSTPLSTKLAQWQIVLIPVSEEQYICMFRVHHAVGDGGSLIKLMMTALVDEEVPLAVSATKLFGTTTKLKKILQAVYTTPMMQLNLLLTSFDLNALHGPKLSGRKRVAWSHNLDLNFVKRMKVAGNCTVNDVLMASLAGAFQTYFRRNCSVCPKSIRCSVPVDMRRPKPGDRTLDNQFSLVLLELPLNESGPLATLAETKRRMDVIKNSAEPIINSWTMYYLMARLPSCISRLVFDMVTDKCSMVVSNLPGPQQELSINGDAVEGVVFWPPQRSMVGLGVSLLSYSGKISMGLIVDNMLLSNPRVFVDLFEDNVATLAEALGVTPDEVIFQTTQESSDC